ncbi:hypothetical protein [Cohnella abietis]|uniref:DUF6199 domain-containing protein n=1 Tax=Cohnella abietis TaxID=2507935 RepID=A0A3T1D8B4_9BACL|nr:hypothetical protein [Cohnella abietis]BBI34327.1 hypothetical protein KCTCHS21_37260 [Cohnella abietis]
MGDRILFSCFAFVILIIPGLIGVFNPELSYRMTATNTQKKKPSKSAIKRYKFSSYVSIVIGVIFILLVLLVLQKWEIKIDVKQRKIKWESWHYNWGTSTSSTSVKMF